jgi:hypothetical protein
MLLNAPSETIILISDKIILKLLPWKQKFIHFLLFQNKIVPFHRNITYSPSHRQAGATIINIQLILRTARDLYEGLSLAVLFGSNGNSYSFYAV